MSVQSPLRCIYKSFIIISFSFFLPLPLFAEAVPDRDNIIQNTLECVNAHAQSDQNIDWAEVCYTGDPVPSGDGREELIDAEMRRATRQMEQQESVNEDEEEYEAPESEQTDMRRHVYPPLELPEEATGATSHLPILHFGNGEEWVQQFEISPEFYYYKYTEVIGVEDSGVKAGILARYTLRNAYEGGVASVLINMLRLESRFSYGQVDYQGSGEVNNVPDYNWETRLVAGYDFAFAKARVTPYGGFGYRYLFNEFSVAPADSSTVSGYDRESQYYYLPLGVEVESKLKDGWSVQFTSELDWFLFGQQTSHLENSHDESGVNAGYAVLENDQDNGIGMRFSLRFKKEASFADLFMEPFLRYWHIKDSDPASSCGDGACFYGFEPDNETWEYGLNAGLHF